MGRHCGVCKHPKVHEISRRMATGESLPSLVAAFGIPQSNLQRHRAKCVGTLPVAKLLRIPARVAALEAALPSRDELGSLYGGLRKQLDEIVVEARGRGQLVVSVTAVDAIRRNLDSVARIAGHDRPGDVSITVNTGPTINLVVERLLLALDSKPEIRDAVAAALAATDLQAAPIPLPDVTTRSSPSSVPDGTADLNSTLPPTSRRARRTSGVGAAPTAGGIAAAPVTPTPQRSSPAFDTTLAPPVDQVPRK